MEALKPQFESSNVFSQFYLCSSLFVNCLQCLQSAKAEIKVLKIHDILYQYVFLIHTQRISSINMFLYTQTQRHVFSSNTKG